MIAVQEHTLDEQARARDNDYGPLEAAYRRATGGELVGDPFGSVRDGPALRLSASIVIPAWNARDTLAQCLIAIEQSSFQRRYPERLEVIVVDDGSTDGTWELLEGLRLNLRLKAVQQAHHSRAQTQNTGIALAEGDVVISCDADMVLAPFSIEELVKRHQVLDRVMLLGFRGDVGPADPRLRPDALPAHMPGILPPFERDIRLSYHAGGWPESMCRDTDHLKRLASGKQVVMADGGRWNLPAIVYGALFSLRRDDFLAMDGYDERFYGWGCEDTLVGVRALALGDYVIPVYGAAGLHVAHGDRSPRKWQEFAANCQAFQAILRGPFYPSERRWLPRAHARVLRHFERAPAASTRAADMTALLAAMDAALADPDRHGKYLHALGRFDEAAQTFAAVRGTPEQEAWAGFDRGKALRAAGRPGEAIPLLEDAAGRLPHSPWPLGELALALAAEERFVAARARLEQARPLDPTNATLRFLLDRPAYHHLERASHYARQGDYALALRDYEAALILDPHNPTAQRDRAAALAALGGRDAAHRAPANLGPGRADAPGGTQAATDLTRLHLALGRAGAAKAAAEQVRHARPRDPSVAACLAEIHAAAARAHPLPLVRTIVERSQAVPGWFWPDETELLVALVIRAVTAAAPDAPAALIEIGSYCGRATVAMGLALRGMGRPAARIAAVDEPSLGPAPDGRSARDVLRAELARHDLTDLVVLAPEEDATPWEQPSRLVLVDGRHDAASVRGDVERYAPRLEPTGLLVFHDYADYYPDVQKHVDTLLAGDDYDFVAHVGSLIALTPRRPAATEGAPEQEAQLG